MLYQHCLSLLPTISFDRLDWMRPPTPAKGPRLWIYHHHAVLRMPSAEVPSAQQQCFLKIPQTLKLNVYPVQGRWDGLEFFYLLAGCFLEIFGGCNTSELVSYYGRTIVNRTYGMLKSLYLPTITNNVWSYLPWSPEIAHPQVLLQLLSEVCSGSNFFCPKRGSL